MQKLLQSLRFSILHAGYAKLDNRWDYSNVISPFARLFFVTKGNAKAYHSGQEFDLRPGQIYFIPSYVYNRYSCDNYHEQYYISFIEEIGSGLSISNTNNFRYEVASNNHDEYYFKRIVELNPNRNIVNSDPKAYIHQPTELLKFNEENAIRHTNRYMETQGILSILLSRFVTITGLPSNMLSKADFNKVLEYIAENLHKPLTIKDLANHYNLTPDHFSRSFKQKIGIRPNKYINSKRVERAQLLLMTTNSSLSEIAEKVGLDNLSYFSRVFKNFTGKTPRTFRKERLTV